MTAGEYEDEMYGDLLEDFLDNCDPEEYDDERDYFDFDDGWDDDYDWWDAEQAS
jgi:hypothetical protein